MCRCSGWEGEQDPSSDGGVTAQVVGGWGVVGDGGSCRLSGAGVLDLGAWWGVDGLGCWKVTGVLLLMVGVVWCQEV